jgi:hypothetical protein
VVRAFLSKGLAMRFHTGIYFPEHATEIANEGCKEFFDWFEQTRGDFDQLQEIEFDTLFTYINAWIYDKKKRLDRSFPDGARAKMWKEFLPLVPCIYVGIIDQLLLNSSLLDYEHEDPILHMSITIHRPLNRADFLSGRGHDYEHNMDELLDWVRANRVDTTSIHYDYVFEPYISENDADWPLGT